MRYAVAIKGEGAGIARCGQPGAVPTKAPGLTTVVGCPAFSSLGGRKVPLGSGESAAEDVEAPATQRTA